MNLYDWNLRLSESFFPLLGTTEIAFRNAVSSHLLRIFGPKWWDHHELHEVMGRKAKGMVLRARDKRLSEKGRVTHGCMTAQLTFGFWVRMVLPKYEAVLWTPLEAAFPDIPATVTFSEFADTCALTAALRNRIFHHEPIFERAITEDYATTMRLLAWLDPQMAAWVRPKLRTMQVLRERPRRRT